MLSLSILTDLIGFVFNLFTAPQKDYVRLGDESKQFSFEGINIFENTINDSIAEVKKKMNKQNEMSEGDEGNDEEHINETGQY